MRMGMSRFTHLTNGFPKKAENLLRCFLALYALQFRLDSPAFAGYSDNGGRDNRSSLDRGGY